MIFWIHSPFVIVWGLFMLVSAFLGLLDVIFAFAIFALTIVPYVFLAYVLARIGRKFNIGSFPQFLVPFYNIILLCDCAKVGRWVTIGIVLPFFLNMLPIGSLRWISTLATFVSNVYLWGNLARRLDKGFWLWGIIMPLLGWLPAMVLAFDSSRPSGVANTAGDGQGARYINIGM